MKRLIRSFLFILVIAVLLTGCQNRSKPLCRFVTQIDITCSHDGTVLQRRYTDNNKMQAVLLYLRLLRTDIPYFDLPDTKPPTEFQIIVSLSDGAQRVYAQKDYRLFKSGQSGWLGIQPEQAMELYRLVYFFESDS